jgi:hypothetical protein
MVKRRDFLAGAAALLPVLAIRNALAAGDVEKGVARVQGDARINGVPAKVGMDVKGGDVVSTFANGQIVFVVNKDAFLVRANSRVELEGGAGSVVLTGLRVVTGALMSVFASGERKTVRSTTATIGIRGTGLYVESGTDRSYVCTCYGETEVVSNDDPSSREVIRTTYHDQPRYVMAKGAPQMLMGAPVVNHTDAELVMLEALVGRTPPFGTVGLRY